MTLDRREMLFGGLSALIVSAFTNIRPAFADTEHMEPSYLSWQDTQESVKKSVLVFLSNKATEVLLNPYLKSKGLPLLGNAQEPAIKTALHDKSFMTYFEGVIAAPAWEESLFRWLPGLLLHATTGTGDATGRGPTQWPVGIATNVLFASFHNHDYEKVLNTDYIPLPQFVGGLMMWHLMRTYGITASIAGHGTYNACYLVALALEQHFGEKK